MGMGTGPRHGFWSVLGPANAAKFGSGTRAARGEVNPGKASGPSGGPDGGPGGDLVAKGRLLFDILGEATRVANRGVTLFAPIREESGLSGIEVLTLICIAHAHQPPTVPQVGRSLGHPRQVIQRAVRVLEEGGLVKPLPNPGHKRAALLALTDKGKATARKVDGRALEIATGVAEDLSLDLEALTTAVEALQVLRRRIDERMIGSGQVPAVSRRRASDYG